MQRLHWLLADRIPYASYLSRGKRYSTVFMDPVQLRTKPVATRNPINCLTTFARQGSDQSGYRFIIGFERFRMTGSTCDSRLRRGIEPAHPKVN